MVALQGPWDKEVRIAQVIYTINNTYTRTRIFM